MIKPMYGRIQAPEPLSNLALLHRRGTERITTAHHEPRVSVLDQSNLIEQGIDTSVLVPGAPKVDSLGSCTANSLVEHASTILDPVAFAAFVRALLPGEPYMPSDIYTETSMLEEAAIAFYVLETHQTGDPGSEWPPTDCGSSGPYIASEAMRRGIVRSQAIAHNIEDVCSLLQRNGVLWGTPFFYAWEEPDAQGFIDGNGTSADLERAIRSGIGGGHELHLSAIERIQFFANGAIDLANTVILFRNHWTRSWGVDGNGRVHASTLQWLGSHCDYRQLRK